MSSRTHSRLWWLWVAAGTALFLQLFVTAMPALFTALSQRPWDGVVDWTAARAWWAGTNPYTVEALKATALPSIGHPPTTSFWFLPLASLTLPMMSQVIGHLVLVALFAQMVWMLRAFDWPTPMLLSAILVIWTVNTTWMQYHLYIAQVSQFISLAFVLAWLALRRGYDYAGGAALGAALTIKLFPALLIFFLVLQRRWKALFAAIATYGAIAVLMTSRFGLHAWRLFVDEEPEIVRYWIGNAHNSTLQGLYHRLLAPVCGWTRTVNPVASALAIVTVVILFGVTYWLARRRAAHVAVSRQWDIVTFDLSYMAVVIVSVVGNPFAFGHYTVLYLPVAFIVAAYGWKERDTLDGKLALILGIVVWQLWRVDMYAMDGAYQVWNTTHQGHFRYHLLEATQWTPPFILLIALWSLLRLRRPAPTEPPPAEIGEVAVAA